MGPLAIDTAAERERTHLYGQSGHVTALAYMSLDLLMLGFVNTAQRLAERSVEEARRLAHPTTLCFAHSIVSRVYYMLSDWHSLARHAAMVVQLADEHGLGLWRALGRVYTGWSRAYGPGVGGLAEGVAMVRDGIARYRAIGSALTMPFYLASLAELEEAAGDHWEALELLSEAQMLSRGEPWISAEIHRVTGEAILAGNGDVDAAAREFRAALVLAQEQGAKLWEQRAEASLQRLSGA
jgi:predicted ATPase